MSDTTSRYETPRRLRRLAAGGFAAGLLLAVVPGTAMAASAFVTQARQPNGNVTSTAVFQAARGEINNVRVHERGRERFDFRDAGRRINVGRGCRRMGGAVVRCSPRQLNNTTNVAPASVRTEDLNDAVDVVVGRAAVNGGAGNDELTTLATVPGTLNGSSGNDLIDVDSVRSGPLAQRRQRRRPTGRRPGPRFAGRLKRCRSDQCRGGGRHRRRRLWRRQHNRRLRSGSAAR